MRIAVLAPSPVPYRTGGAERLWDALTSECRARGHDTELLKLPCREYVLSDLIASYRDFARVDLHHFDCVITGKYPAWAVDHPNHVLWMLHPLRGLYDRYPSHLSTTLPKRLDPAIAAALRIGSRMKASSEPLTQSLDDIAGYVLEAERRLGTEHPDLAIPSPVAREIVHSIDSVCLDNSRVRRHAAISRSVAQRPNWFPRDAAVSVVLPPLSVKRATVDQEPRRKTGHTSILVVGRLEAAKRIDLAIDAIVEASIQLAKMTSAARRQAPGTSGPDLAVDGSDPSALRLCLDIVGEGPHRSELEKHAERRLTELQSNDLAERTEPLIRFHGRVDDRTLSRLYTSATAVVFTPDREDFGFVALEAMSFGTPVITATDSDGPLELIENAETGWVVEPTPAEIAKAIVQSATEPIRTTALATAAKARAMSVTWDSALAELLERPPSMSFDGRRFVVALSTYPIFPKAQGGPLRAWHLLKGLADIGFEVEVLSFSVDQALAGKRYLSERFHETVIAISREHQDAETQMRLVSGPNAITDVACSVLWPATPDFTREALRLVERASAAILVQPFLSTALHRLLTPQHELASDGANEINHAAELIRIPVILDAHNGEYSLKSKVLSRNEGGRWLLQRVHDAEQLALTMSSATVVTTDDDRALLVRDYGEPESDILVVPNGTDVANTPYVHGIERVEKRRTFLAEIDSGQFEEMVVFVGSGHQPNVEAAKLLAAVARGMPDVAFVLIGRHSDLIGRRLLGPNVTPLGPVPQGMVDAALSAASVGVNPMVTGGGSNLKLTSYFAAGTPVVTTELGARGVQHPSDCAFVTAADVKEITQAIRAIISDPESAERRAAQARKLAERELDWRALGARFATVVADLVDRTASDHKAGLATS